MTIILSLFAWLSPPPSLLRRSDPPGYRPHSNLGQDGEHALAFVLLGLAFGLAYTSNRLIDGDRRIVIGVLEILQSGCRDGMRGWRISWSTRWPPVRPCGCRGPGLDHQANATERQGNLTREKSPRVTPREDFSTATAVSR